MALCEFCDSRATDSVPLFHRRVEQGALDLALDDRDMGVTFEATMNVNLMPDWIEPDRKTTHTVRVCSTHARVKPHFPMSRDRANKAIFPATRRVRG